MKIAKRQLIICSLMATLSLITFSTCNDDDRGLEDSNNGLKAGQIEIKAYPDKDNKISFYATAKKITIDWGDGSRDEITPNGVEKEFMHEYSNQNFRTISITTESITSLKISNSLFSSITKTFKGTFHELRFGNCTELKEVYCCSQLTILDIKNAAGLQTLDCSGNQLATLYLSGLKSLTNLYFFSNQTTAIDVSGCTALIYLILSYYDNNGKLTSLDVKGCVALQYIYCSSNQLTSINISGCKALIYLDFTDNQLSTSTLNKIFNDLPTVESGYIHFSSNPGASTCDESIAKKKGWNSGNSLQELIQEEKEAIDKFIIMKDLVILKEYPIDGVFKEKEFFKTNDGLFFQVVDSGNGKRAKLLDDVSVRYEYLQYIKEVTSGNETKQYPTRPEPFSFVYGIPQTYTSSNTPVCQAWVIPLAYVGESAIVNLIIPSSIGSYSDNFSVTPVFYKNLRYTRFN